MLRTPLTPLRGLLTLLAPSPCVACDRPISAWRPHLGLCVHCRGRLRSPPHQCRQCGVPIVSRCLPPDFRCGACRVEPPHYDRLYAPFLYVPPLDSVVRHLKYSGLSYLGAHAAAAIASRYGPDLGAVELVVPVPLHWSRRMARGYNQAQEIARPLADLIDRPHLAVLRRRRRTAAQASLSRQSRRQNPVGAFSVRRPTEIDGLHVLLVDDVVTTGATVEAAARALDRHGAGAVTVAALARTPPPQIGPVDWQDS